MGLNGWLCAYCGGSGLWGDDGPAAELASHLAIFHGWRNRNGKGNRACRLCRKRFQSRTALGRHLRNDCTAYHTLAAEQALRGTTLPPWNPPPRKPRPKKPPKPKAVLRLENTKKLLALWERKLKLATTKVKKYRAQLKRHKRLAEKSHDR